MKKETLKTVLLAIAFTIALFLAGAVLNTAFGQSKQLPRLDTITVTIAGKDTVNVILTDREGVKHEVLKSENGRSYIWRDGKRFFFIRKPEIASK